jgi:lauroyl/myristoyl acyltransferase
MLALDPLPWPWAEDVFAKVFVVKAFVRPRRLRTALVWADRQPFAGWSRWRLALSSCAHHGGFLARQALLGIRTPEDLLRHVVVTGEEHLAAASKGAILLGFHLGPPGAWVVLRAAGYRLTWVGGRRGFPPRSTGPWQRFQDAADTITISRRSKVLGGALYEARRRLLEGGSLYIAAEGASGRDAFCVALPGGTVCVKAGWFVLSRQCRVPVLPVLTHLEGRTQVITIHSPLPAATADPASDLEACRSVIAALLESYVRRFPEQCYGLTFARER